VSFDHKWLLSMDDVSAYLNREEANDPRYWICSDMRDRMTGIIDFSGHANYAIDNFAEKVGLLKIAGVSSDPESSCTYFYFDTKATAQKFVNGWNKAITKLYESTLDTKRKAIAGRLTRINLVTLMTPKHDHVTVCDHWWALDDEGHALVYAGCALQCHSSEAIAKSISKKLYSGKVEFVPVAYIPRSIRG
jgi:hypothetical protein